LTLLTFEPCRTREASRPGSASAAFRSELSGTANAALLAGVSLQAAGTDGPLWTCPARAASVTRPAGLSRVTDEAAGTGATLLAGETLNTGGTG